MTVYLCLVFFIVIVQLLNPSDCKSDRLVKTILFGIATWVVMALRSPQLGVDLVAYCARFNWACTKSFAQTLDVCLHWDGTGFEPGFIMLNKLISLISTDIQFFLATIALIIILPISVTIYRYSKSIYLSFIIFISFGLFNMAFSGLRQSIAFAIAFWSTQFIVERKPLKFFLTILIASTVHTSVWFFLLMYLANRISLNNVKSIVIYVVFLMVSLAGIKYIFPSIVALFFDDKYSHYTEGSEGAITLALIYITIYFGSLALGYHDKTKVASVAKFAVFIAVCIQSICMFGFSGIARLGFYFAIYFTLFIPDVLTSLPKESRALLTPLMPLLFILFYYLTTSGSYLNPYHFFWEPGYGTPSRFVY